MLRHSILFKVFNFKRIIKEETCIFLFQKGPALLCWSDSIFTDDDLENIKSLGDSYKNQQQKAKIGRFGLGFNTTYHLSDAPQFISNYSQYVIFDPLCKYYPNVNESDPGQLIEDAEKMLAALPDVLAGFDIFPLKNATMFRLALRCNFDEKKFISKECHQVEDVKQLMTEFMNKSRKTLIFLKNIRSISFYELSQRNGKDFLVCLRKEEISVENELDAENRISFYQAFKDAVKNDLKFTQISYNRIEYKARIEIQE